MLILSYTEFEWQDFHLEFGTNHEIFIHIKLSIQIK